MVRVFITGSSDGIGLAAAKALSDKGHQVTLHARNAQRAKQASDAVPKAEGCLIGNLSSISETKQLAEEANKTGKFDAVIRTYRWSIDTKRTFTKYFLRRQRWYRLRQYIITRDHIRWHLCCFRRERPGTLHSSLSHGQAQVKNPVHELRQPLWW